MYSEKEVVYKLHAGWFINRTEFINWGLCIKFKGLLCGNSRERGESLIPNFWPPGFISPTQAPRLSAASEGLQNRKNTIHQIFTLSNVNSQLTDNQEKMN